ERARPVLERALPFSWEYRTPQDLLRASYRAIRTAAWLPKPHHVEVDPDGQWFVIDGAERVDIATRKHLSRLFRSLYRARRSARSDEVSVADLFAEGWPGERAVERAADNRVRVAISSLRGLGLAEAIETRSRGYGLSQSVVFVEAR